MKEVIWRTTKTAIKYQPLECEAISELVAGESHMVLSDVVLEYNKP